MLGDGGYGCVFYPPMQCQDMKIDSKKYVSKVQLNKSAKFEYETIQKVKMIAEKYIPNYQNYLLLSAKMCKPPILTDAEFAYYDKFDCEHMPEKEKSTKEKNKELQMDRSLIILPYAGENLAQFIDRNKNSLSTNSGFEELNKVLIRMYQNGIRILNEHGIYHCDIKTLNIVVMSGKYLLIDWGLANNWFYTLDFVFNRPYCYFMFHPKFQNALKNVFQSIPRTGSIASKKFELAKFISSFLLENSKILKSSNYYFLLQLFEIFSLDNNKFDAQNPEYSYLSSFFPASERNGSKKSIFGSLMNSAFSFRKTATEGGSDKKKKQKMQKKGKSQKRKKNKLVGGEVTSTRSVSIEDTWKNHVHPVLLDYFVRFLMSYATSANLFDMTQAEHDYKKNIDLVGLFSVYLKFLVSNPNLYSIHPEWFRKFGNIYYRLFLENVRIVSGQNLMQELQSII